MQIATEIMVVSGSQSADHSLYDLEFRSTLDDGWYNARVVLENDTLVVKFWNFPEESDERFKAGDFETVEAVNAFVRKFRLVSQQLQDSQCLKVVEGMTVCASLAFRDDDVRFYDAVVEAVHHVEHLSAGEEEECLCTFVLFWQHGPNEGNLMSASVANICLIQHSAQIDSRVASFSKMATDKIEFDSPISGSVSDGNTSMCEVEMPDKENSLLSTNQKYGLSQHRLQVKEGLRQFSSLVWTIEEAERISKYNEMNFQDTDFGGESSTEGSGSHHFILIENLEKDLSPSSVVEFIHKQTSISPQAYVFPSLSSDSYTKGVIELDSKKELKKIYEFLNNPDHFVTSSQQRPWVISEKSLRRGTFSTLRSLVPVSQHKIQNRSVDDELKVVNKGDKEYSTIVLLRDLYMEFVEHQKRLHKKLASEEEKILQLSTVI